MMNIGEFAQLTGLSTKALRIYDEQGLLRPASVDPWTGYRRYTAAQLAAAVRIKGMREAGVPLADAPGILAGGEQGAAALAAYRESLAAERERQDAALAAVEALLRGEDAGRGVAERRAPAQHWAGAVLPAEAGGEDTADGEAAEEEANAVFAALWRALSAAGNRPAGPFWSTLRAAGEDGVELLCCWPVPHAVPQDFAPEGLTVESGLLPERTELAVSWRYDDPIPGLPGAVHPAVLMLLAEAERRGAEPDLSPLRQIGLLEDGHPAGVEVAVALA